MNEFIIQDGKKLRLGYTTGSCAAAASKAAAYMLLSGRRKEKISIETPKGMTLELDVLDIKMGESAVSCAVKKDAGDDPDVTDGALVYSKVALSNVPGVHIDGGEGVGRVTKPGLDQPVGNAAINSVPRRMIKENVEEVMKLFDCLCGLSVVISIPAGEALAKKTFNPRLGIVGGISVLGTTGIVEPMSEKALVETIRAELNQRRALGAENVLLTPGNYGAEFIKTSLGVDPDIAVQTSNFIGDSLDICRELGFKKALLIGHIGKLVKLAGNMMNTHSKYGDCRMEILAAHSGAAGADAKLLAKMLSCVACDEAVRLMREVNPELEKRALKSVTRKAHENLKHRAGDGMTVEMIMFSKEYGILGETENAREYLKFFYGGMTMVHFVGAGPGAADLITVRGAKLLKEADVVIWAGSLVNPELLSNCKEDCDVFDSAKLTLEEVIEIIKKAEAAGKTTVRLHTGDSSIFGAVREQFDELDALGIEYDVTPGVSSFCGAAASLKAEYTLPGVSQTVIITRAAGKTPVPEKESIASLAEHRATMVLFLSTSLTEKLQKELLDGGYPADTPAAVVYKATWPDERVLRCNVGTLDKTVKDAGLKKTSLIIVGGCMGEEYMRSLLYHPEFTTEYRKAKE